MNPVLPMNRDTRFVPRAVVGLAVVFASLLAGHTALGQSSPTAVFEEANRLYAQARFLEAITNYTRLVDAGHVSPAVYFNLGNAHFKAGQLGHAIAAYRFARELTPRDPDVQANLKFARNQVQGPTASTPSWQQALGSLSLDEWTVAASISVWTWLLLIAACQWRPDWRPALRNYTIVAGVCALLLAACLGARLHQSRTPLAIVTSRDAVVRQAPLAESERVCAAGDGAELPVIDRKDDWLQLRVDRSRSGWIRKDQVLLFH